LRFVWNRSSGCQSHFPAQFFIFLGVSSFVCLPGNVSEALCFQLNIAKQLAFGGNTSVGIICVRKGNKTFWLWLAGVDRAYNYVLINVALPFPITGSG
jgi:hypothetical protein